MQKPKIELDDAILVKQKDKAIKDLVKKSQKLQLEIQVLENKKKTINEEYKALLFGKQEEIDKSILDKKQAEETAKFIIAEYKQMVVELESDKKTFKLYKEREIKRIDSVKSCAVSDSVGNAEVKVRNEEESARLKKIKAELTVEKVDIELVSKTAHEELEGIKKTEKQYQETIVENKRVLESLEKIKESNEKQLFDIKEGLQKNIQYANALSRKETSLLKLDEELKNKQILQDEVIKKAESSRKETELLNLENDAEKIRLMNREKTLLSNEAKLNRREKLLK